jgi:hypothetical protein
MEGENVSNQAKMWRRRRRRRKGLADKADREENDSPESSLNIH